MAVKVYRADELTRGRKFVGPRGYECTSIGTEPDRTDADKIVVTYKQGRGFVYRSMSVDPSRTFFACD